MDSLQIILMGIVQGLSEFLPISSSGHIVFTSNLYKVFKHLPITQPSSQEVFIDIMLHLGTLIAVIIFFRQDIVDICKSLYKSIKTKNFEEKNSKIGLFVILGTIITVIIAIPLNKIANNLVFHPAIVGALLVITGFMLFLSEYLSKRNTNRKEINNKTAMLIGLSQGIAVLPGFSRSGWTMAMGLFCGLNREQSARFSFLLSIPIIFGASMIYPIAAIDFKELSSYNWLGIIVGTIVSGIVGYICIKYFMKFIAKFSLNIFAYYCITVGILALLFFKNFS